MTMHNVECEHASADSDNDRRKPKISRVFLTLATLLTVLSLPLGCMSTGQKMDQSKVDQIKKGVTTRAELETMFGTPFNVAMMGEGKRMMVFMFATVQVKATNYIPVIGHLVGGTDDRQQILKVILNKDNIVEDYEFSDKSTDNPNLGFSKTIDTPAAKQ